MTQKPVLLWLRRDLRLSDHPALTAAVQTGAPIIPVFIRDPLVDAMGRAPKWRLERALSHLQGNLEAVGSALIQRSGDALEELQKLVRETGAGAVYWSRDYTPASIKRDTRVKAALKDAGVEARSFKGFLLFEPPSVQTQQGSYYKVYSPFWRAVRNIHVEAILPRLAKLPAPDAWPVSEKLTDWGLGKAMNRGAAVIANHTAVGEQAAQDKLAAFLTNAVEGYKADRDFMAKPATSGLSEYLTYGEISARQIWHAGRRAMEEGASGAEHFLKELVWREFSYHLAYHTPHLLDRNWKDGWDDFPWGGEDAPHVKSWKMGRTGVPLVDAAMREMYITGKMHNRARMIAASYLTKHLMVDWKVGLNWFADCLTDWDPAANALGWQWVAGCGPDAAPFFRIFNPETQCAKFDPDGTYIHRWIAEGQPNPGATALSYFDAIPRGWGLCADGAYPDPVVGLKEGRERALQAYHATRG
ncbi:cryptochrome/photolyase family protein [Actibacterium pelagium]|uniref:Deoxyribodipyrimidine photo-lyase n=1 Tax=Actibacterium pelagium TaxID=2029103 RepID=A0A917ACH6_9RHOB|nr:deoxyribodipyrimidine photo-lyase [Actibacterium pelagium]GGE43354.1 deoxyribodipyrimidine photo-lyase [Actibacterium pelagium]